MRYRILMMLIASTSLFGVTQIAMANVQNGFYLGGDIGIADLMTKESHSVSPESHQLGTVGAVGGAYIGYDQCINSKTGIAIEAFGDVTGLQTSIKHAGNTYKMYQRYNLGVRLLPEYNFTPFTTGHLIIGYTNGHFQIKDNGVYGLINTNYNKNGLQTGMGVATALQNNLFIRLDALYDTYSSTTKQGAGLPGSGLTQLYTNRFSQLAGELSLYYQF